jgi:hypothetical protein
MQDDRIGLAGSERLLLLVILAAAAAILWSAFRLPMYDAASHAATAVVVERFLAGDPFTTAHAIEWVPVPYWFTTLALLGLSAVGPDAAMKLLFTIHLALVPAAFFTLARTAAPRAVLFTPLVALTAFGAGYWSGETNYVLAQPWALFAVAAYLRARRMRSRAFAAFALCALLVYLAHIFVVSALLGALLSLAAVSLFSARVRRIPDAPPFTKSP